MARFAPINVPDDWRESEVWRLWEAPLNVVHGESFHQAALWVIAGKNDGQCRFVPVKARLVREPWNQHGAEAIRIEVCGI
jgi:hypothetical protein